MRACIATILTYPGLLNVKYELYYHFTVDSKQVAVGLNGYRKGLHITDNNNYHEDQPAKTVLHHPIESLTRGHIFSIRAQKDPNDDSTASEDLKFSMEPQPEIKRDMFIAETYYTEFLIFMEFPEFKKEIYDNDNKRERYNATIIKALNHFIHKYNYLTNSGNIYQIISNKEGSNFSYIMRQTYFEMKANQPLSAYIQKNTIFHFKPQTFVLEIAAKHGMPGTDPQIIEQQTTSLEAGLQETLSQEEIFLSAAWQ